jgi:hypothetical protein
METRDTPPPLGQYGPRGTDWEAVIAEVEALDGKWGRVGQYHQSVVTRIREGKYPAVDPTKYEVTSRRDPETGKSWLWMRRMKRGEWMKKPYKIAEPK